MASLKYIQSSTLQSVTLGANYTAGDGSMTLTAGNGAYLPSSGDFWLSYNNGAGTVRLFKVTARSTDTLTVTPVSGEGSGDGNISSGETLRWALTYDALNQLKSDIIQTGGLVLLEQKTASSSSSLDFTSSITSTYDEYQIELVNLKSSGSAINLGIQVSTNGGSSYITTGNYTYAQRYYNSSASAAGQSSSTGTFILIFEYSAAAAAGTRMNASIKLWAPADTADYKTFSFSGSSNTFGFYGHGFYNGATTAINAFRIIPASGTIASGVARCYGVVKQ